MQKPQRPRPLTLPKATCAAPVLRGAVALPWSKTPSRTKGAHRNLRDLAWPAVAAAIPGRDRKSRRRSCRGTREESDGLVVPMKRPKKPVITGGGGGGGKGPGRREGRWQGMPRTPCRTRRVIGAACLRTGTTWLPSLEHRSRSTFGRSPVRESRTPGSARGAVSNHRSYRNP